MPSPELLTLVDRLRQASATRDSRAAAIAAAAVAALTHDGLAYRPGTQVIDLVSGQKGVILGGQRYTVISPAPERHSR